MQGSPARRRRISYLVFAIAVLAAIWFFFFSPRANAQEIASALVAALA